MGDYYDSLDNVEIPYKVIFGNVYLKQCQNEIGDNLQIVIGDFINSKSEFKSLGNIQIVYGNAYCTLLSRLSNSGSLKFIGKNGLFLGNMWDIDIIKEKIKIVGGSEIEFGCLEIDENEIMPHHQKLIDYVEKIVNNAIRNLQEGTKKNQTIKMHGQTNCGKNDFLNRLKTKRMNQEKKTKKDRREYLDIEPTRIEDIHELDKKLKEYIDLIDLGNFEYKDLSKFLSFFSGVDGYRRITKQNYIELRNKLEKIKGKIAKFYECTEDEILLNYYDEPEDVDGKEVPYKVIFGNVNLSDRCNKIGDKLEVIFGTLYCEKAKFTDTENIRIVYGSGYFNGSEIKRTKIERINDNKDFGGNIELENQYMKNNKERNERIFSKNER